MRSVRARSERMRNACALLKLTSLTAGGRYRSCWRVWLSKSVRLLAFSPPWRHYADGLPGQRIYVARRPHQGEIEQPVTLAKEVENVPTV